MSDQGLHFKQCSVSSRETTGCYHIRLHLTFMLLWVECLRLVQSQGLRKRKVLWGTCFKKSNCCVLQMGRWEASLVAGSKLRANRKFPITPELTDYWQHQKQLGPPTSHVSFSEERVGLASWHTNKHTYIWGPYRFVLRRHRASFPACLPSVHPLSLHYSTTDPLMVNISDTDAAEKCWQHKSLSAGSWTRREICSASSHTEAE